MSAKVRYFRSQNYRFDQEISEKHALEKGFYVRGTFIEEQPERAEIVIQGQLDSVVYYGRDTKDRDLVRQHRQQYGAVAMTIYDRPLLTPEGELQTLSEWNASGELIQITKRLVDDHKEPLREEIVDSQGALRGIRRFEYEGTYLARIIFTRADGAEIVELED